VVTRPHKATHRAGIRYCAANWARRVLVIIAAAAAAGAVATGPAAHQAQAGIASQPGSAAAATLYVEQYAPTCNDSGPGTQAEPFCTIQAAANVVAAGQTVDIEGDNGIVAEYAQPVVVTRSGTPTAPITFTGVVPPGGMIPDLDPPSGVPLTLDGVHDVTISHLAVEPHSNADGIDVTGSQEVTLDNVSVSQQGNPTTNPNGITIDGTSANVTVSRSYIIEASASGSGSGYGIRSEPGGQQITIMANRVRAGGVSLSGTTGADVTTNYVAGGISLSGTTGADVTSNSVAGGCSAALTITGGSSAGVEDNHFGVTGRSCSAPVAALSVATDSTATVQADYNALIAASPNNEYSWAGTIYASAGAFSAATGQGGHDIDAATPPAMAPPPEGSALIDSADCGAPGELSTDLSGNPHVDDRLVTDTGTGTCHADRGAAERQDSLSIAFTTSPALAQGPAPLALEVTAPSAATSPWNEPVTYTADFGDGGGPVQVPTGGTASHTYTTPGLYTLTVAAADTGGTSQTSQRRVVVGSTTAPNVTFTAGPEVTQLASGPSVDADSGSFAISAGADDWELASGAIAFGDGTSHAIGTSLSWDHQYAQPGTYTARLTETDLLGRTSTATTMVTVGDEFQPDGPYFDYDSRARGGTDKIPSHAVVKLSMTALNAYGDDVRAVNVNVAVLNPKAAGFVTVYPDRTSRPAEASVKFQAGQAASNKALAIPGSDRVVDFYNGSSGPIDLVVHTFGLDTNALSIDSTYTPDGPVRVLTKTPVAAHGHVTFAVAGTHGVPAGAVAAVLDVTASGTGAGGYLTAYSDGAANPRIRDADWAAGQIVTGLAVVPLIDGKVVLHNSSSAGADFNADLAGYYTFLGTGSVFLPARHRILDTLTGTGTGGVIAKLAPGHTVKLQISGKHGIPATGISAVEVNLTASDATAGGFIESYPHGTSRPTARSLSYGSRATTASAAIIPVGSDGAVDLYNGGSRGVNLIVDLTGSYYQYPSVP
jgi:PKD domain/Right handed beta helix region